jgi:hypothetical protein
MRRLLRFALNIAVAMSVVLCVATALLWARSVTRLEQIEYLRENGTEISVGTCHHGIQLAWLTNAPQIYIVLPRALRPRRGWSGSSHRLGSAESFDYETERGPDLSSNVASFSYHQITVFYQWVPPPHYFLGFGWGWNGFETNGVPCKRLGITFPLWLMLAIFAALPLKQLLKVIRSWCARRRVAAGLCISCGYDLRASTGRCPECGAIMVPARSL